MINNMFRKNTKANMIGLLALLIVALILLVAVSFPIIQTIKDKADDLDKVTCGSSDLYSGICVNKTESCASYGAGSKEYERYKDACLVEDDESTKDLKCCVPSRDPIDQVYFELEQDKNIILKNGLTLNTIAHSGKVSFKLYFPKFFQCDMLHFYLSGECSASTDKNCKFIEGEYFLFPNAECKTGTSMTLSLNSGACKLVAECYPKNYKTPAFTYEVSFNVDSN